MGRGGKKRQRSGVLGSILAEPRVPTTTIRDGKKETRTPDGLLHADGFPAISYPDGSEEWYAFGQLHRLDGPALDYSLEIATLALAGRNLQDAISSTNDFDYHKSLIGDIFSPDLAQSVAVKQAWHREGVLHRTDGPARVYHNGSLEWWRDGEMIGAEYTEEFLKEIYTAFIQKQFGLSGIVDFLLKKKESQNANSRSERRAYSLPPLPLSSSFADGVPDGNWEMLVPEIRLHNDPVLGKETFGSQPEIVWQRETWRYQDGEVVYKKDFGGKEIYYNAEGKPHREDGPAVIYPNGREEWYKEGQKHRMFGPAVVDGDLKQWYKEGEFHREDGPALITSNSQEWYREGKLHREDGPACVYDNGREEWWVDGKRHRLDGPAVISLERDPGEDEKQDSIIEEWWKDDERHREGGPAILFSSGRKVYYKQGKKTRDVKGKGS